MKLLIECLCISQRQGGVTARSVATVGEAENSMQDLKILAMVEFIG
jgi:hypothetical protein